MGDQTRKEIHESESGRLKTLLAAEPKLLLHHDGKKYDERGKFVECLPLLASGFVSEDGEEEHLLEIPTISDGKAKTVASKAHAVATESEFSLSRLEK